MKAARTICHLVAFLRDSTADDDDEENNYDDLHGRVSFDLTPLIDEENRVE